MKSLVLRRARGFTLVELLITLSVAVVLLTLGLPSMQNFFERERLIGATEQIYSHLQQARIESIARSKSIYTKVVAATGDLQYGISQRTGCAPSQPEVEETDACVLIRDDSEGTVARADIQLDDPGVSISDYKDDLVLMSFNLSEFTGISVTDDAGVPATYDLEVEFEPLRGTASTSGSIVLMTADKKKQLKVELGLLGQISICSPNDSVSGYRQCPAG